MRGRCVATDKVYPIKLACQTDTGIKFLDMLQGETARYTERHSDLLGSAVHSIYIREIHDCRLVAQMLQWNICKVKMNIFK